MLTKEIIENTKTVTIAEELFEMLSQAHNKLLALEQAGVDNWDGYDYAMEILEDWEKME